VGVDGRDKRGHDAVAEPLFADQQPNAIRAGNFALIALAVGLFKVGRIEGAIR